MITAKQAKKNVNNTLNKKLIEYIYEDIEKESLLGKTRITSVIPATDEDDDIKRELEDNGFNVSFNKYNHVGMIETYWTISWE